jgi:hypothetical protein
LFAGFFPSRPDPEFAMLIIIDEPKINTFGGSAAAPVFSRIASEILKYRESIAAKDSRTLIGRDELRISAEKVQKSDVL